MTAAVRNKIAVSGIYAIHSSKKGDIMYKLDKILQKVFIIIGILVTIFIFTIATASYQLRKDFEEHKYERLTTAEPSKSIEWYQAAGKRPPE